MIIVSGSRRWGSNPVPQYYQYCALPGELRRHITNTVFYLILPLSPSTSDKISKHLGSQLNIGGQMLLSNSLIIINTIILLALIIISLTDFFYFKKMGAHLIRSFNSKISVLFLIMGMITLVLMSFFSSSALSYFIVALFFFLGANYSAERYRKGS